MICHTKLGYIVHYTDTSHYVINMIYEDLLQHKASLFLVTSLSHVLVSLVLDINYLNNLMLFWPNMG